MTQYTHATEEIPTNSEAAPFRFINPQTIRIVCFRALIRARRLTCVPRIGRCTRRVARLAYIACVPHVGRRTRHLAFRPPHDPAQLTRRARKERLSHREPRSGASREERLPFHIFSPLGHAAHHRPRWP